MADFKRPRIAPGNGLDQRRRMKEASDTTTKDNNRQHRVRTRYAAEDVNTTPHHRRSVDER